MAREKEKEMKILVTGVAGFIGMHVAKRLLHNGNMVFGIDNLNNYYDPSLKEARLKQLEPHNNFIFRKIDIANSNEVLRFFADEKFDKVIHLAAQPGVRYSITNPHAYLDSNIVGFLNILEGCRHNSVSHLIFASSSSVYGLNSKMPFSEHDSTDHPISLYAATKKAGELMAHSYSHLYDLPITCLRFFTVYGPWGRPDMSASLFASAILSGKPINVFNYGKMKRDFTFIDDIVEGVISVLNLEAKSNPFFDRISPDPATSCAPYRVLNIGNNQPKDLMVFINALEGALRKKAIINMLPMQDGDALETYADINDINELAGFEPKTSVEVGIKEFINWYLSYYS